ncbi:MAG: AAA family ATPase [Archaeoglobi archaeon]|nr:AAA family ATPase [Candidatus Mnemosynella sp.]
MRSVGYLISRKGSSLLIRGYPGTGKTLMALSLIYSHRGDFFYISTRVSPEEILEIYPHLKEEIQRIKILDASKEISLVDATMRRFSKSDEISDFLLSVRYEDKPAFIRALVSLLRDSENPLVIIDSVEAIQESLGREILSDLLELSDEIGFSLVIIVERGEMGREDYLVDGVIELERRIDDERVLRKMRIHKLRGCSIPQPEYLFTLKDGKFRLFEPFSYEIPKESKLFEPLEDPDENRFSSGSEDLDEIFGGGFRKGSSILLEISEGVTRRMYHRFVQSFYLNFLRRGRRVYLIPTLGTDKGEVINEMRPFLREEELKNLIFIEREWGKERLRGEEAVKEADRIYERLVYEERKGSYEDLHVTGVDASYSRYGEECIRVLEEGNAFVQETRGLRIRIAKPGFPFMKELSNLSDIHIKMENFCNVPVIKGEKPKTQYYAMLVDLSEGFPKLRFEKVE